MPSGTESTESRNDSAPSILYQCFTDQGLNHHSQLVVDGGASHHVVPDATWLTSCATYDGRARTANSETDMNITGIGTWNVRFNSETTVVLQDVLVCPMVSDP